MTNTAEPRGDAAPLAAGRRTAPARLVLVRHGQSMGNLADERAHAQNASKLDLETRDADTPLSDNGLQQAQAVGAFIASLGDDEKPTVVLCSPYERARNTALTALEAAGLDHTLITDERLRERDLGILDGWTGKGIREHYPEEAERRDRVGKFYYRPSGGESWCDVALRVRSLLADVRAEYTDAHVWIFTHQAVIMAFRLVLESLDERALLDIDANLPLPNCSITSYSRGDDGALALQAFAVTSHIDAARDAETTAEPSDARQAEEKVENA